MKGSNSRSKARKLVARVHERLSNARQDDNQVIVVENLNVKGMVQNHKLAKAIDENAAKNILAEGIRMLTVSGTGTAAVGAACAKRLGGDVRPHRGRKSVSRAIPIEIRSPRHKECWRWVVHVCQDCLLFVQ